MGDKRRHLALFVAVVCLVVGGATAGLTFAPERSDYVPVSAPQYDPDAVLAHETPETGAVTMSSEATDRTVLVDVAHDNDVSPADLRPLVAALARNGHRVRFHRGGAPLGEALGRADAYLVVNPRSGYGPAEADAVRAFVDGGGRLLVLADPPPTTGGSGRTTVEYHHEDVTGSLGAAVRSGYLYNVETNANNFKSVYAAPSGDDGLGAGVDRVVFRDAAAVESAGGTDALVASPGTVRSTTRREGRYAVAVRDGDVAVVGDSDFLTGEAVYAADNEVFVGNLADFLVNGTG